MSTTALLDGIEILVQPGETILQAARRLGIDLPTLCQADRLHPEGGCRMCLVRCEGMSRPVAACHTALEAGMRIITSDDGLEAIRRTVLGMYLESAAQTQFAAVQVADGRFRRLLEQYGLEPSHQSAPGPIDDSHPLLRFNPQTCIACRLCLNACEQIQGQFVYGITGRGARTRLIFGPAHRFNESPCVACGACVDVCPTGAITDRDRTESLPGALNSTHSICGYCGVGCRIDVITHDKEVRRIAGIPSAQVNQGHLCLKGRYAHSWQRSPERLTKPLVRKDGTFREASWEEAIAYIARRLREIKSESGPDALGALASSRSTNEACYLLQKLFRSIIGTNNIDCCARVCHSSTALALQLSTGMGAATASFADIERASCIVVAGANPTEAHPVIGARIKQAALRGIPLVVIDPRKIELADHARLHLQLQPGTNVALFNALAKITLEEELHDVQYTTSRTEGLNELAAHLDGLSLTRMAEICGVPLADIRAAAWLMSDRGRVLFVHGLGLSELMQGTASVMTLCNLGMLTGSIGFPGSGMLPLRGQNNVQGSADMGSTPTHFPGYQSVADPKARELISSIWNSLPPDRPGLTSPLMLQAAVEGRLRGLWLMGEDVAQSDPNQTEVLKALEHLDLLVVQDLFLCESAKYAHVVLPAAGYLEQEGTFTNGERRIQHVRAAVPPPGEALPDWEAIIRMARELGADWDYASPAHVMGEISLVAPSLFGGVSYERLGADGLQWPCPEPGYPGTATVHADGFVRGKGRFASIDYEPSPEHGIPDYPYLLITGRLLEHYNVGTMTRRSELAELVPADVLEIHPEDAKRDGLADGAMVRVESRWGAILVPVHYSTRVAPGSLFLSFHFPVTHANQLTGPTLDPQSNCPQYKAIAVKVTSNQP